MTSMSARAALLAMSTEEMQDLSVTPGGYADLLLMRQAAYKEHVAEMPPNAKVQRFAQLMTLRHGPKVKIHANESVSWPVALMIARHGEDIRSWPSEWDIKLEGAADKWLRGSAPFGVTYLPKPEEVE